MDLHSPTKRAVIVADDEQVLVMGLRLELKSYLPPGVQILTACDGQEALDIFQELEAEGTRACVLISDWKMPGMSGSELLRRVHKTSPETLLIMLSGKMEHDDPPRVPHQFFGKPWRREALRDAVLAGLVEPHG